MTMRIDTAALLDAITAVPNVQGTICTHDARGHYCMCAVGAALHGLGFDPAELSGFLTSQAIVALEQRRAYGIQRDSTWSDIVRFNDEWSDDRVQPEPLPLTTRLANIALYCELLNVADIN